MHAITTKFLGATDTRPARVTARTADGRNLTIPYDGLLSVQDAHRKAVKAWLESYGTAEMVQGEWVAGELDRGYAFVMIG